MPTFVFEHTRWPGMRYGAEREQEAQDVEAAIVQFLAARGHTAQHIAERRSYPIDTGNVPRDCNIVYQVDGDAERLVAAFTVPLGQ
jgi:hypothetical protein